MATAGAAPAPQKKPSSRSKRVNVEVPEMVTEMPSVGMPGEKVEPITHLRGRLLGKGGFAAVYELQNMSDGKIVAGKVISKESLQRARARAKLETEIAIHRKLDHPNIVKFLRSFEDSTNVYILLECCTGKTLADLLRSKTRLGDAEVADLLEQTITAIKMLHESSIIHRDLKLSNLFLDQDGRVKVGDFGLACQLSYEGERKTTICGTPNYIAPEVLAGKQGHSFEVDVWSLGVILYTLLIGKPPFETSDVRSTYRRIRSNAYMFPEGVPISEEASDLIRRVLKTEPDLRPSIDEMLAHPFFTRFNPTSPPATPKATADASAAAKATAQDGEPQVVHVNVYAGSTRPPPPPTLQVPSNMPSTPEAWARFWGTSNPSSAKTPTQQASRPPLQHEAPSPGLGRQDSSPGLGDSNIDTMSTCPMSPSMSLSRGGSGLMAGSGSGNFADLLNSGGKGLRGRYGAASPTAATPTRRTNSGLLDPRGGRSDWQQHSTGEPGGLQRSDSGRRHPPASPGAVTALAGQLRSQALEDRRRLADPPESATLGKPPSMPVTKDDSPQSGGHAPAVGTQPQQTVAVSVRCDAATLASLQGMGFQVKDSGAKEEGGPPTRRPPLPSPVTRQQDAPHAPLWQQPSAGASPNKGAEIAQWGSPQRAASPQQLRWDAVLATSPSAAPSNAHRPSVWVTKWVDYSSKYGMGYVLSNGAVGVLFNDATKVLLLPDRSRYIYLEKSKSGRAVREERLVLRADEEPPPQLKKKATLLWYFEGYLKGANFRVRSNKHPGRVSGECVGPGPVEDAAGGGMGSPDEGTYVKKWLKTRHAIIFRLSNKVIQVDFNDDTEIVLSSEMQSVTYVNKARESITHWLSQLPQDVELLKRLKYTKDILLQLIGGSSGGNSSSSSTAAAAMSLPVEARVA